MKNEVSDQTTQPSIESKQFDSEMSAESKFVGADGSTDVSGSLAKAPATGINEDQEME